MNAPTPSSVLHPPVLPPRARGTVRLSSKQGPKGSVLDRMRQAGSLKVLFPRKQSAALDAVLINTAGGVTGGDQFTSEAKAGTGTTLSITTQAAERAYRAMPGQIGTVHNTLSVASGARINWLPQETILFQGSALDRRLKATLQPGAQLLICEPLVFGRAAMDERLTDADLRDQIEITRDGTRFYLDRISLHGNINDQLARPGIAGGAGALATVLYVAPDAEAHLDPLRALCPETGGVSQLHDDVLALRVLAEDSHLLRLSLFPILKRLSGAPLPRPWTL